MLEVKFRKHFHGAQDPVRSSTHAAGYDLTACWLDFHRDQQICTFGTGLSMQIPEGYAGFLFPRSSVFKHDVILANCVGVIDSDYRGEILFKFKSTKYYRAKTKYKTAEITEDDQVKYERIKPKWHNDHENYKVGDRIGQIIILPIPQVTFTQAWELDKTDRGEGGFGSTGA